MLHELGAPREIKRQGIDLIVIEWAPLYPGVPIPIYNLHEPSPTKGDSRSTRSRRTDAEHAEVRKGADAGGSRRTARTRPDGAAQDDDPREDQPEMARTREGSAAGSRDVDLT